VTDCDFNSRHFNPVASKHSNMAGVQTCEVGANRAPVNVGP
jgi:hypothetical protein